MRWRWAWLREHFDDMLEWLPVIWLAASLLGASFGLSVWFLYH